MRKIILSLIVLSGVCLAGRAEQFSLTNVTYSSKLDKGLWGQIDAWPKGEMTNELFCAVRILQRSAEVPNTSRVLSAPTCYVQVANTTTNSYHFLNLPDEGMLIVELFDSKGRRVANTDEGGKFTVWTQKQIGDWFEENDHTHGVGFWVPPLLYAQTKVFSIPQTFQVKEAGEYTLHLWTRLVKSNEDATGKVYFTSIWLPEVVAKVQIRPEDIVLTNLPSTIQTNSLPK